MFPTKHLLLHDRARPPDRRGRRLANVNHGALGSRHDAGEHSLAASNVVYAGDVTASVRMEVIT